MRRKIKITIVILPIEIIRCTKVFKTRRIWIPRIIMMRIRIVQITIRIITIRSRIKLIMIIIIMIIV